MCFSAFALACSERGPRHMMINVGLFCIGLSIVARALCVCLAFSPDSTIPNRAQSDDKRNRSARRSQTHRPKEATRKWPEKSDESNVLAKRKLKWCIGRRRSGSRRTCARNNQNMPKNIKQKPASHRRWVGASSLAILTFLWYWNAVSLARLKYI